MVRILLVLLVCVLGIKQGLATEIKFRKVTKEELQETECSIDKSAHAAYLYKFRKTYVDFQTGGLITEVHERIKIYDKVGLSYGVHAISLFGSQEISSLKAYTYNLVDDAIKEVKFKKDGMFETPVTRNIKQTKLSFPEVREGAIIEYKYKVVSPYYYNIDEIVLQHDIPIKKLESLVRIRSFMKVNKRYKGKMFKQPIITKTTDPLSGFGATEILFKLEDVPALKKEPFVANMNNYRAGMEFEVVSVKMWNGADKNYATTWDAVTKSIYENSHFGNEIKKIKYFKEDLNKIIKGAVSKEEKMYKIFDFVQQKMTWNNHSSKYTYDGVKKAYKEGKGNVAEINFMLISMMKEAGLRVYPVLVSTRKNGVPVFPTRNGFNYVIAAVKIGEDYMLLDASSKNTAPNILPERALNWYGRIISDTGKSREIELMPNTKSIITSMINVNIAEDGEVEGKMMQQFKGQYALDFRDEYSSTTEENFLEAQEKNHDDIEISNYKVNNIKENKKPVVVSFNFLKEDMAEEIAEKLYFSPLLYLAEKESPFKVEEREFPIDYGYPWQKKHIVTIKIPEGFKVESLPKSLALSLPDNLGGFKYQVSVVNNVVKVISDLNIQASIINTNYYKGLKEFYRSIIEKQTEKVVLSRI